MQNIQTKKSKLNLQIRGLGQAAQPVVESDMESVPDAQLTKIIGGQGEGFQMAMGKTRGCGGGGPDLI